MISVYKSYPTKEIRMCLCCGKPFEVQPIVIQDLCNRCNLIVAREFFKADGNMTLEELKEKIKKRIGGRKW